MQQSEKDFKSKMTKLFDSVIGGRYIGFAMKAEGIAVLTANTLYAEDIQNLISKLNADMCGNPPYKELDAHKWRITPTHYKKETYIIEKVPLTRKRYVEERTPLMEVRLFNA